MKIQEFLKYLFEIEITAHIAHLQTKSYAQHTALNTLYDDIVDLRDRFIESYQGKYGIITEYEKTINVNEGKNMSVYLREVSVKIENYRLTLTDGFLQQITDDILELIYSTKYKLDNLR